jgi:L-ribulose-5-phosphate 3-epimerase
MVAFSRRGFNVAMATGVAAMAAPGLDAMAAPGLDAMALPENAAAPNGRPKLAAQSWTFHNELFKGEIKAVQLPGIVKTLGIDTIEWTAKTFRPLTGGRGSMFQAPPASFFRDLRKASDDAGVRTQVFNVGGPYYLAGADAATRQKAIDYCMQYVEGAQILGSPIFRSELYCDLPHVTGREDRAKKAAMEGWNTLLEKTADTNLIISVENHHGISAEPVWLADLVRSMKHPRIGLTVDVNNFRTDLDMPYDPPGNALPRYVDRYRGLEILMPLANWVSAKTYTFDSTGYEIALDYPRIMKIIRASGYAGPLSIEYEGNETSLEGLRKSVEMFRKLAAHGLA